MSIRRDEEFAAALVDALDAQVAADLMAEPVPIHRTLAARAKTLVAAHLTPGASRHLDPGLVERAHELIAGLAALQAPSGLFTGGDNVQSPPDSAFTVNDLADTALLLRHAPARTSVWGVDALAADLQVLLARVTPALLAGGVHTPNHRWELAAALARLHRLDPQPPIVERVARWLAEGVDIDADGLYSERSANYAALVSNPSLIAIGSILGRPELLDAVEANLTATLDLLLPDGSVETVMSRRQDQRTRFDLGPYLVPLRLLALERGRGDLAWAAVQALRRGIPAPGSVATEVLLNPRLLEVMPDPVPPVRPRERYFTDAGLVVRHDDRSTAVVFGGSDHARHGRVRSGLANSPTFVRLLAGTAVLDSVRLSRTFFGLGPFRSDGLRRTGAALALREEVAAAYYQPLAGDLVAADGRYGVVDEGRFAAAMDFGDRARDVVSLSTSVQVQLGPRTVRIEVTVAGPHVDWALELAFRPGGVLEGMADLGEGRWLMRGPRGVYRVGSDAVVIEVEPGSAPGSGPARYEPGEEYAFLGGSDAAAGERVYLTGAAPGTFALTLRAVSADQGPAA